jgi:hypothetical protein
MTMEDVKAKVPARLQPDPIEEAKPLSKDEAMHRLAQIKNVIKGRGAQTTSEVVHNRQHQVLSINEAIDNQTGGNGQPGSTKPTTSRGCPTEVERSITKTTWLEEE